MPRFLTLTSVVCYVGAVCVTPLQSTVLRHFQKRFNKVCHAGLFFVSKVSRDTLLLLLAKGRQHLWGGGGMHSCFLTVLLTSFKHKSGENTSLQEVNAIVYYSICTSIRVKVITLCVGSTFEHIMQFKRVLKGGTKYRNCSKEFNYYFQA